MKGYIRNRTDEQKRFCNESLFGVDRERARKKEITPALRFDTVSKSTIKNTCQKVEYSRSVNGNYESLSYYRTPYGVIEISQLDWEKNGGRDVFTHLLLIKNKRYYSAWVDKARFGEKLKKRLCENFISHFKHEIITDIQSTQAQ